MSIMLAGGVISLRSYWAITNPKLLKCIDGNTASVEMGSLENGSKYLYVKVPFVDGTFVCIKVHGDLDEGDIVDISSIVLAFRDNPDGSVTVTCDAIYSEDNIVQCNSDAVRKLIMKKCEQLMSNQKYREQHVVLSKKRKQYKKSAGSIRGPMFDLYEMECYYNQYKDNYSDEALFYAMTDGQYGDYPDEGSDNDYEPIGY